MNPDIKRCCLTCLAYDPEESICQLDFHEVIDPEREVCDAWVPIDYDPFEELPEGWEELINGDGDDWVDDLEYVKETGAWEY